MKALILFTFLVGFVFNLQATAIPQQQETKELLALWKNEHLKKSEFKQLQARTQKAGPKGIATLIQVMKGQEFPDRNRWSATILLSKLMGKDSSQLLVKYTQHPHWMLRMAALRGLLGLSETKYGRVYAESLKDSSLLVRGQALDNIRLLQLKEFAPQVWAMIFDERNYYSPKDKAIKRGEIIKKVIRTIGDLKYDSVAKSLVTMIKKDHYRDIFNDLDYGLEKLSGRRSPQGSIQAKRDFWSKQAVSL